MLLYPEDLLKLVFAILIGGVIGAEREYQNKAAGFRTLIFICVGACLYTIFSVHIAKNSDPARIAAQIVTGVGFIGGGVIMHDAGRVHGLTTAATIWLVAALGIGIGSGEYATTTAATLATLIVLLIFPRLERGIDRLREERTYEILCPVRHYEAMQALLKASKVRVTAQHVKTSQGLKLTWTITAHPRQHQQLIQHLLMDAEVQELSF